LALLACHTAARTSSSPGNRSIGTYAYRATIGSREELGTFTISADTVLLDADYEMCRREIAASISERSHAFNCDGAPGLKALRLIVDSNNPGQSFWSATTTGWRTREVCVAYALTASGARVCTQTRNERYEADVNTTGRLRVTPVAATDGHR
jgi:hypothetical protein